MIDQRPDPQAVGLFEERYGRLPRGGGVGALGEVVERMDPLPYENLSKILVWDGGRLPAAPRLPAQVVREHLALGTGGTCFSLTELMRHLVGASGLPCYPVLAHMRHGANIHCALVAEIRGRRYLVDPGYLVRRPLALDQRMPRRAEWGAALLVRVGQPPRPDLPAPPAGVPGGEFDLYTVEADGPKWRYRFSDRAPERQELMAHWLRSFSQPGMRSLLATRRMGDGGRLYLHDHKLRSHGLADKVSRNVRGDMERAVSESFGIDPGVTRRAWATIQRQRRQWRQALGQQV